MDPRNFISGHKIPTEGYCDQPYVVITDDDAWLCVMTTCQGSEGDPGQHVVTMRSTDQGKTWDTPVNVEPEGSPENSYAVLYKAASGRIYCFYDYNTEDRRYAIADNPPYPEGKCYRVDSLGDFVFKFSDDHGRSWSDQHYVIPVREFECDRNNPYQGKVRFFWNVGKTFELNGAVYVPIHKVGRLGKGFFAKSEGALLRSKNMRTEPDPEKIEWETLPEGDIGLRTPPGGGPIAEEQNFVTLDDGSIYVHYRTIDGHPVHAYSRDGGRTWTEPEYTTFKPGGRVLKNPRADSPVWKASNGRYLLWYHNNSFPGYCNGPGLGTRNIVWLCGGREIDGFIHWSQPEIALYTEGQLRGISYPDFVEDQGRYFFTSTQKTQGSVNEIDPALLEALWNQDSYRTVAREGLLVELTGEQCTPGNTMDNPELPTLLGKYNQHELPLTGRGGFTIDFQVSFEDPGPGQILADTRDRAGIGWALTTTGDRAIRFEMGDGFGGAYWDCDSGLLKAGVNHKVSVIIDGGPKSIVFVIDELLNDGGEQRIMGFGRFSPMFRHVNGEGKLRTAPRLKGKLHSLRIYDRPLLISEVLGNHRAAD